MSWGRVSICFLCISLGHCSSKIQSVDETLTSKKASEGGSSAARHVENVADKAEEKVVAAKAAAAAAVPAIRVSNTCKVKVCSKQDGHSIDDPMVPHWYHDYLEFADGKRGSTKYNQYFSGLTYYTDVPRWQDVEYCVTMFQKNDYTYLGSWYKKVPAGRFYWFIVGYVETDEESMEVISKNKDACSGETIMRWKYILDAFHSGDDFTKLPTENNIDDLKPSDPDSIINTRQGKGKFLGKVLVHMARWHSRKAFWFIDSTTVEFVDRPAYSGSGIAHSSGTHEAPGLEFKSPVALIQERLKGTLVALDIDNRFSFWGSLQEITWAGKLSVQKGQLFDEHSKASPTAPKAIFLKGFEVKNGKTAELSTRQLFAKVAYQDYRLRLAIVACGLFPKTMPVPKNCDVKGESEGA